MGTVVEVERFVVSALVVKSRILEDITPCSLLTLESQTFRRNISRSSLGLKDKKHMKPG
jgi:hypothetical protein